MDSALQATLLRHAARYPLMQPQDLVKLLYQREFGGEHFIKNPQQSLAVLQKEVEERGSELELELISELASVPLELMAACESLGNGVSRLHLNKMQADDALLAAVNRIFVAGARHARGSSGAFEAALNEVGQWVQGGHMPFGEDQWRSFLKEHRENGRPILHHSDGYRSAYRPSYRLVLDRYLPCLDLIRGIESRLTQHNPLVLSIDGYCGSGKSTLAALLGELYDCDVIAMDDFFLPPALRTPERLAQPGGNIHYERFVEEVAEGLKSGKPFEYTAFDCSVMAYGVKKRVDMKPLVICEGSYSAHPQFESMYHYRIFVMCSRKEQRRRLLARSGPELFDRFINEWIPMENIYFQRYAIRENSHISLDTTTTTTAPPSRKKRKCHNGQQSRNTGSL